MRISPKWALVLILASSLLFAGCAGNTPDNSSTKSSGENDSKDAYPKAVMEALEIVKPMKVGTSIIVDNKTYIIASFGEQPTAGYEAKITDTRLDGNEVTAQVALEAPQGDASAAVVTYPYAVKVLEGRYENVKFIKEGDYMPSIIGLEGPLKKPLRSSGNIMVFEWDPAGVSAEGIARVFEATISYIIRDEEGKVLREGFTQAASSGPDWGYFKLEASDLPQEASELVLYQASAKDGSVQDEVLLPLQ